MKHSARLVRLQLMHRRFFGWFLVTLFICTLPFLVATAREEAESQALTRREWNVGGVTREALLHIPKSNKAPAPVVFVFHGHGGSMRNTARSFRVHELWPEAIVVYMQGLNTPGHLTDPEGKRPGWQRRPGDQGDRDLKFFDAVLAALQQGHQADTNRVFATGHSNGGAFTYLLWQQRGEQLAAIAPSASLYRELLSPGSEEKAKLRPLPVLHLAGEKDSLVQFDWQTRFLDALRKHHQCSEGKPWKQDLRCVLYQGRNGGDVLTYIHEGGHNFPSEGAELIVKFFKAVPASGRAKQ
ncbi:MAG: alpha/beta hydrolase family esterase [Limisphaerales bacterium]